MYLLKVYPPCPVMHRMLVVGSCTSKARVTSVQSCKTPVWAASKPVHECLQIKVMCSNPGEHGFIRSIKVSNRGVEVSGRFYHNIRELQCDCTSPCSIFMVYTITGPSVPQVSLRTSLKQHRMFGCLQLAGMNDCSIVSSRQYSEIGARTTRFLWVLQSGQCTMQKAF